MNILLWVLQVLLAAAFLAHGWMMLFPSPEILALMNATMSTAFRVFLGVAEVLAAIGLTLPGLTRIVPALVWLAAAGLAIVMICATVFHGYRGEYNSAMITTLLLAISVFVAYMRWKVKPIAPRIAA